jgi:hypothetical protein
MEPLAALGALATSLALRAKDLLEDRSAAAAMDRALQLELRYNLNVLDLLPKEDGKGYVPSSAAEVRWRVEALSTQILESYLTLKAPEEKSGWNPLRWMDGRLGGPKRQRSLHDDLGYIFVKVRELRVITSAPEGAALPTLQWGKRYHNLKQAHIRALKRLATKE